MSERFKDRVAIVTGAASGIGAAIVKGFLDEGALVIGVDVSAESANSGGGYGGRRASICADVSKEDELKAVMSEAVARFGRLDILCNNAGVQGPMKPVSSYTAEGFDGVLAVNARGVFLGMKYAIPIMAERGGGAIVNTASMASFVAFPQLVGYCASKGAVLAMTRTAAVEYASKGIRINCVCPGAIRTRMLEDLPGEYVSAVEGTAPMRRAGLPSEVASAVLFLASDEASFITGTSLIVDGGYTAQ